MGRDFYQANVQAHEEVRGNSTSWGAHTLYAMEDKTRNTQQNETWQEQQNETW